MQISTLFLISIRYRFNTIEILNRCFLGIRNSVLKPRNKLHFHLQTGLATGLEATTKPALLLTKTCTFGCSDLHFWLQKPALLLALNCTFTCGSLHFWLQRLCGKRGYSLRKTEIFAPSFLLDSFRLIFKTAADRRINSPFLLLLLPGGIGK